MLAIANGNKSYNSSFDNQAVQSVIKRGFLRSIEKLKGVSER